MGAILRRELLTRLNACIHLEVGRLLADQYVDAVEFFLARSLKGPGFEEGRIRAGVRGVLLLILGDVEKRLDEHVFLIFLLNFANDFIGRGYSLRLKKTGPVAHFGSKRLSQTRPRQ